MAEYSTTRREPRIRLCTRVKVSGQTAEGEAFSIDTVTIDVSQLGARVVVDRPVPVGSKVEFFARNYAYRIRAAVRSVTVDPETGAVILGLEFLGKARSRTLIWTVAKRYRGIFKLNRHWPKPIGEGLT
jgi:hypothetical protein